MVSAAAVVVAACCRRTRVGATKLKRRMPVWTSAFLLLRFVVCGFYCFVAG